MLGRCGLELVVGSTIGCTLVPVEPWQDVSKYHLQLEPEIGDSFQVQCPSEGQEFGEGRLNWSWQAFCLELLVFFGGRRSSSKIPYVLSLQKHLTGGEPSSFTCITWVHIHGIGALTFMFRRYIHAGARSSFRLPCFLSASWCHIGTYERNQV